MSDRSDHAAKARMPGGLGWAAVVLCVLGLGVSLYLLSFKLGNQPQVCLTGHGCADVNASPYSFFLGIPVSVYGILAYVALLVASVQWVRKGDEAPDWVLLAGFGLSVAGFAFSVYLTYLEAFVIHAYCSWCLTSFAIITILMVLFGIEAKKRGV